MWPGFKSRRRSHVWAEFVVDSLPCSERFFCRYPGFPLSSTFPNSNSTRNQVNEGTLGGCAASKSLFILFFYYRKVWVKKKSEINRIVKTTAEASVTTALKLIHVGVFSLFAGKRSPIGLKLVVQESSITRQFRRHACVPFKRAICLRFFFWYLHFSILRLQVSELQATRVFLGKNNNNSINVHVPITVNIHEDVEGLSLHIHSCPAANLYAKRKKQRSRNP